VVLAELRANPPPEEERKKMWPPFDAGVEARRIVWGLSEAALEEAALGARAAARAEGEAAGEGREPEAELAGDDALAAAAQKPDTPLWPEHEMTALSRYEASIERALARASATLDKLQQRRKSEAEPAGAAEPSPPLSRQQRRAAARHAADKGKSAERTGRLHFPYHGATDSLASGLTRWLAIAPIPHAGSRELSSREVGMMRWSS